MLWPPEFQKYIWRDFTISRIAALMIFVTLVVYLDLTTVNYVGQIMPWFDMPMVAHLIYTPFLYFIIMLGWAGYRIANALLTEVNENTWDYQRLSALSSWDLTLGCLFGSTLYCWLAGVILLGAQWIVAFQHNEGLQALGHIYELILLTLITHAFILISALQSLEVHLYDMSGTKKLHSIGHTLFGLWITWLLYRFATDFISSDYVLWYGMSLSPDVIYLVVLGILLVALFQYMRVQLGYRTSPIFWALGVFTCMMFVSGFTYRFGVYIWLGVGPAFFVALASLYYMLLREAYSSLTYRRLAHAWECVQWHDFLCLFPRWGISLLLSLGAACWGIWQGHFNPLLAFSFLAFACRDILLMHVFLFSTRPQRALVSWLFVIGLSYFLLPAFLSFAIDPSIGVLFAPHYLLQFNVSQSVLWQIIISGLIQTGIVFALVLVRWPRQQAPRVVRA